MKIKVHFTRNSKGKIFSRAIQWYEGMPVSHVCVEIQTKYGPFIYHSRFENGVSLMPKERFLKDNEIMETYSFKLTTNQFEEMRKELLMSLGETYALMQNLGIIIVDFLRRRGLRISNPWKSGQNCSELVYSNIVPYLFEDYKDIPRDLVKPSQIRGIFKEKQVKPIFSKIKG